ncbi:hypothetical protein [Bacillus sp. MMSF_3328]|uniref:hypothetical protein n=1 Tax=Bacillus sp. MMSF_3328 TaxID=3047080 RepID=UPI00273D0742|nr:hypothetical protein [Bacillus sp. MMSF_3328]
MADNTGNPINANNQGNANQAQSAANTGNASTANTGGTMSQADLQSQSAQNNSTTGNQAQTNVNPNVNANSNVNNNANPNANTQNQSVANAPVNPQANAEALRQQNAPQVQGNVPQTNDQVQTQIVPTDLGNGWYQLPDGSQVQGREQAYAQYEQWKQSNQVTIQQQQAEAQMVRQQANTNPNAQNNVNTNDQANANNNAQINVGNNAETNANSNVNAQNNVNTNANSNQVPYEPKHVGGGWYQLSTGEKIQGEQKAKEAQAEISRDEARNQAGEQRAQTQIQQPVRVQVVEGEAIQAFGPTQIGNLATVLRFTKHDDHSQKIDISSGQILYVGQDLTPEEAEQLLALNNWKFERVNVNNG